MAEQRAVKRVRMGQAPLPGLDGDLGKAARAWQWKELREAAQVAILLLRQTGRGELSGAADRLERAVNAMPTL